MMMIGLNPTALIIVCVLLSIPVSANANIIGGQALEEQLNKAKELVERAINATGLDYQHTGLEQQSKEYAEKYSIVMNTCNNNSGNRQMVELCDKLRVI